VFCNKVFVSNFCIEKYLYHYKEVSLFYHCVLLLAIHSERSIKICFPSVTEKY
jgi:hypothetical protein